MLLYVTVLDLSSKKETFCNNLIFNPFNLIVIHPVECLRVIVGQGQETKRENALNSTDGLKFGRYRLWCWRWELQPFSPVKWAFQPYAVLFSTSPSPAKKAGFSLSWQKEKKDIQPKTTTIKRSLHQLYS